ncbi:MAG TPA: hypothetical protein VNT02_05650 [Burkholderiales bacterium]|nr:hypothetical protein [Burkholderiales bacterium]
MTVASAQSACVKDDAKAVAETACRRWEEIATRIAPIIGERGFRALYARSVHLVQARFPWVASPAAPEQAHSFFVTLAESLERQPSGVAADAQRALLMTFTQLLDAFIGEALTSRLLQSAPSDGDAAKPSQENSQ